jgi:hypothetical protein
MEAANPASLSEIFRAQGRPNDAIVRDFRNFNAWAWQFRQASEEAERA